MIQVMKYFSVLGLLFTTILSNSQNTGTLTIEVKNLRNSDGIVMASIYNSTEGYPTQREKAFQKTFAKIKHNKATLKFKNLPFGEYAIALTHDENNNHKIDQNWLGIPKEGVGASNNAQGKRGPPDFNMAKFPFRKSATISIEMVYIF